MNDTIESADFLTSDKEGYDLVVYQCGMEKCKSKHSYGPAVRDHFLIHYILDGEGSFHVNGSIYKLKQHQGFLICPDIITYYEADIEKPWFYTWVGFKGLKAEKYLKKAGLDKDNPIFIFEDSEFIMRNFEEMRRTVDMKRAGDVKSQGLLTVFLSELIEKSDAKVSLGNSDRDIYVKKAMQYIDANYSRDISISDIASYIGLNRNYFSSVIKEQLGISLQEYLVKYRVTKAIELMQNKDLSIGDISRSVGYNDPLGFSKMFKKVKGHSPKKYRETINDL